MDFENLNQCLKHFGDLGIPGYDCIVRLHGVQIYRRIYGEYTGVERYNLYSCSKPLTAVAALLLYEQETDIGWGGAAGSYTYIGRKNRRSVFYAQHVPGSPVNPIMDTLRIAVKEDVL